MNDAILLVLRSSFVLKVFRIAAAFVSIAAVVRNLMFWSWFVTVRKKAHDLMGASAFSIPFHFAVAICFCTEGESKAVVFIVIQMLQDPLLGYAPTSLSS
jgi:hypothetical protein